MTWKDDVSTLDPAIGYDWQNWSMIKSLFGRLLDYEPGTTKLRPDLAESYTISEDGKIYTFKLRSDIKFHNGRAMTAEDVKYSIERMLDPKTKSPGQGFYTDIKGFKEFVDGKAKEVSGVKVVDPSTVSVELSQPNAAFLHLMAINFSAVVPKEEVEKYGEDFGKHPVGTGPYKLAKWDLGKQLVFERNATYHLACVPKLDQITFEIGQEPTVALLRLERGEVDALGDGLPPSRFVDFTSNPKNKDLFANDVQMQTGYVAINTQIKPFDNVKVRQALNMAINKERVIQIINGRAKVATQVLPPIMPGYDPAYKGYEYNPQKAKALLAEAGFANGFSTQLFANNTDPNPRIAQAIQQDLAAVGIKAELKTQAQSTVIAAGGEKQGAPLIWSGGMAWIADFPDPSNFYWPILSCTSVGPGSWNWAWYCNESLDAMAKQADAMVKPEQAEARAEMYKQIFTKVMDDAPWVPIFNEQRFNVHSAKLAGPGNVWIDPVRTPFNYDYIYAEN
ncbi:ABC transporter substrate-binding protein [Leptolyngbya sp. FACHB-261]|uniref:ABC transporter substrate-binding protein n=1 Tax=Leptolyngbya sp. FACHB-261 TaxID=2692806 RepID=UPI001F54B115|nr:ABC transporter substrate-binding protein [Leptolyngbya sp. FACHB-261]